MIFDNFAESLQDYLIDKFGGEDVVKNKCITLENEGKRIIEMLGLTAPEVITEEQLKTLMEKYVLYNIYEIVGNISLSSQTRDMFNDLIRSIKDSLKDADADETAKQTRKYGGIVILNDSSVPLIGDDD